MLMGPRDCKEHLLELGGIVIVPTYNNAGTIGELMASLIKYSEDILVVNDGCTDSTSAILATFGFREISLDQISAADGAADAVGRNAGGGVCRICKKTVLNHPDNMGKGTALKNALMIAQKAGYRYAVTIDADGQHFPQDIPSFVEDVLSGPGGQYL